VTKDNVLSVNECRKRKHGRCRYNRDIYRRLRGGEEAFKRGLCDGDTLNTRNLF
jgi:hypothetical protein